MGEIRENAVTGSLKHSGDILSELPGSGNAIVLSILIYHFIAKLHLHHTHPASLGNKNAIWLNLRNGLTVFSLIDGHSLINGQFTEAPKSKRAASN